MSRDAVKPAPEPGATPGFADRSTSPYTAREKFRRALWWLVGQPALRLTFHNWYAARRVILRFFGARIGANVRLRPSVRVEQPWNLSIGDDSSVGDHALLYCLGEVRIGRRVSISQRAHICAGNHDYRRRDMRLLRPPIAVEDDVWIAADAFVGPGVTIHDGAILGARGCAFRDLAPWTIYGGNPAVVLGSRKPFD